MTINPSYDDVRQHVARRFARRFWFIAHIVMAIVTTGVIWLIDPTPQDGTPVLAALWFGVLICHAVKLYMDGVEDKVVEREWEHYSGALDVTEKPKRTLRLGEDDILEVVEDEGAQARLRSR